MSVDWNLVMACLGIMVKGMIGIFIVILVIWALVALLNRFTGEKKPKEAKRGQYRLPHEKK